MRLNEVRHRILRLGRTLILGFVCVRMLYLLLVWAWEGNEMIPRLEEGQTYRLTRPVEGLDVTLCPLHLAGSLSAEVCVPVRLLGLELPDDRRVPQQDFAAVVSRRLQSLMAQRPIHVQLDRRQSSPDKRRWLAYVFADGVHLNRLLVEEGLAVVHCQTSDSPAMVRELLRAQRTARVQGAGCWRRDESTISR